MEGLIGLPVTALAERLAKRLDARLVLEDKAANPYLERFYRDPQRWAFQAQLMFLASRYRQQRAIRTPDLFHQGVVADHTFDKDRIFAELNLEGEELDLYQLLYAEMAAGVRRPDVVVFVIGSLQRSIEAIRTRDRSYEKNIDEQYLGALQVAYWEYFIRYAKAPLIVIESDRMDCVNDPEHFEELVNLILKPELQGTNYLRQVQPDLFS